MGADELTWGPARVARHGMPPSRARRHPELALAWRGRRSVPRPAVMKRAVALPDTSAVCQTPVHRISRGSMALSPRQ